MARTRITHEVDNAIIDENTRERPELAAFAKTLNRLLVDKGIHQDDLANELGISSGSISSYRNGTKEPRMGMIVKIADKLGVDCHYLMTGVQASNYLCTKELGLSGEAINRLLYETTPISGLATPTNEMNLMPTLNTLLTSGEFWKIVRLLSGYVSIPKQELSRAAEISREYQMANYGVDPNNPANVRDILRYNMQRAFNILLDGIDNNESQVSKNGSHS